MSRASWALGIGWKGEDSGRARGSAELVNNRGDVSLKDDTISGELRITRMPK